MASPKPIRNRKVSDHVYDTIKKMIDEGALPPGSKIQRKELEDQLGVSQTPINDALSRLAGEKLLYQENRRGYYVAAYSDEELVDLFAVRAAIEGIAARLCAECASETELADLVSHFCDYTFPITAEEHRRYAAEDKVFHNKVIRYSHNEAIRDMYANNGYIIKSNQRGLVRPPRETIGEHQDLIRALAARNAHDAWVVMTEHHLRSRTFLQRLAGGRSAQ